MRNCRSHIVVFLVFFLTVGVLLAGETAGNNDKPTVAVVNYPLKYFAERIGGDRVNVVFPIPPDVDPAFWLPEPEGVFAFQVADLILLNGATYSKWLDKVSLPRRKLVHTSQSFKDQYVQVKNLTSHTHGPKGAHAHAGMAFTTWIDFQQAIKQAEAIRDALARLMPQQKNALEANFSALKDDLSTLNRRIKEIVATKHAQSLVASHPVYDYFARRYSLNIQSVLWEPDEMPSNEQWAALMSILRKHPAKWMIWEGRPNADSVDKLKSIGMGSVIFDPCANIPDEGDFLSVMRQNVKNLRSAFQ